MPDTATDSPSPSAWTAATMLAGSATVIVLIASRLGWDAAPLPFVWSDVALVAFLSALPLAAIVTGAIGSPLVHAALTAGAGLLCLLLLSPAAWPPGDASALVASFVRALAASAAALALVAAPLSLGSGIRGPHRLDVLALALALAVSLALPWLYVQARCRHDLARLQELMEQRRIGETAALAERLARLAPHATVRGLPLAQVAQQWRQLRDEISARASAPLPPTATFEPRLRRANELFMLGRFAEALDVLEAAPNAEQSAAAWDLRGVIHESRNEFALSLEAYSAARDLVLAQPRGEESTARIIDTTKGMAYCQRKLARYDDAERSYLELLAFAPTADSHFLLAQFYEDTQQAGLAEDHARQAIALDPERYANSGQQLTDKLITHHFGCWGVFANQPPR